MPLYVMVKDSDTGECAWRLPLDSGAGGGAGATSIVSIDLLATANPDEYSVQTTWIDSNGDTQVTVDATPITIVGHTPPVWSIDNVTNTLTLGANGDPNQIVIPLGQHTTITGIDFASTNNPAEPNEVTVVLSWVDEDGNTQTTTDATPFILPSGPDIEWRIEPDGSLTIGADGDPNQINYSACAQVCPTITGVYEIDAGEAENIACWIGDDPDAIAKIGDALQGAGYNL